jgi:sugar (glycoside-pentoside-hexuronide) transporter
MGSLGKDLIQAMFIIYLLVFYTDVFGLSPAAAGVLLMVARSWEAVLNPVIGTALDYTNTGWGRFRPYVLIVPIPFLTFSVLTFTVPGLSASGKLIYAYITYIIAGTSFTIYDVSFWSMVPSLSRKLNDRSTLISLARVFTMVAAMAVAVFAMPVIGALGHGNTAHGYTFFLLILAPISLVFAWLTFFNTKERIPAPRNRPALREYLRLLKNNGPLYITMAGIVINGICLGMSQVGSVYHLTYVFKRADLIPLSMVLTFSGIIAGTALAGGMCQRLGNRKATLYSYVVSIVPNVVAYVASVEQNIILFFVMSVSASIAMSIPLVSITGMVAETVDYTEWKKGIRADGLIFSLSAFSAQLGLAFSSGVTGIVLQAMGYIPNAAVQTHGVLVAINLMRNIVLVVIAPAAILIIRLYPFNKEEYHDMIVQLDEMRVPN